MSKSSTTKTWRAGCFLSDCLSLGHMVLDKGVGEGGGRGGGHVPPTFKSGGGGARAPHFQKWGGAQVGLCPPPTFGQSKCSRFTICAYFVVKNTIFSKFSWLASLANFDKPIFSKLC